MLVLGGCEFRLVFGGRDRSEAGGANRIVRPFIVSVMGEYFEFQAGRLQGSSGFGQRVTSQLVQEMPNTLLWRG
jgi:hypothetical protein